MVFIIGKGIVWFKQFLFKNKMLQIIHVYIINDTF